ncbi:GntR family transcriptional regulator [Crossiella sp. SN42]|uniref:GntR family transcriptional regulator n=1 Tax=Crossiella sp. SN42 TaxID=2944808 RepID=UPI00207CB813|nr:GntR family transcriptional regulator [Crossiella sp. SN42]MCO1577327.1 GntR family transcriptional regulator [Crossiella sp. SN42]
MADPRGSSVGAFSMRVNRVAAPVREQVLDQLRQAIVEMRLEPGKRLVERELIEQTGVSRTTIREVLRQLSAEGLVETIPHRGTVVASVSRERAVELYEVRAALEGMAARAFAERASEQQVAELRRAFEEIESCFAAGELGAPMLAAKARFYDTLLAGSGNETIREIVEGLQARVTVLRTMSLGQPGRAVHSVAEIREIVEAAEARDAERAATACAHHVRQAAHAVLAGMDAAAASA